MTNSEARGIARAAMVQHGMTRAPVARFGRVEAGLLGFLLAMLAAGLILVQAGDDWHRKITRERAECLGALVQGVQPLAPAAQGARLDWAPARRRGAP